MKECNNCGEDVSMPYDCRRCNQKFCSDHRLPENHNCPGLQRGGKDSKQIISEINSKKKKSKMNNVEKSISKLVPESIRRKSSGNMWAVFLGIIGVTYLLQLLTLFSFGENVHNALFVLEANNLEYFWTILTSIFSHSPGNVMHIIGNAIILLFFGRILERIIGTRNFTILFLVSGAIAGISQIILSIILGNPTSGVLGASGALLAVLGALTIYNPKMKVYLYFFIPIPLWVITVAYVFVSIFGILSSGGFMGNIAHIAHISGLLIGLGYGIKTQDKYNAP
jgi:Uncharacterized membrane protein (homolog of Drosophila rhomboid)